jgi:ABC-type iron transport system FetAB permease component
MLNVIIYAISTLLTYIFGIVSKKFKLNETLPIPIQNIIVGISCFLGVFLADRILGNQFEAETVIQQIVVALGGAGTATLGYDTQKIGEEK